MSREKNVYGSYFTASSVAAFQRPSRSLFPKNLSERAVENRTIIRPMEMISSDTCEFLNYVDDHQFFSIDGNSMWHESVIATSIPAETIFDDGFILFFREN